MTLVEEIDEKLLAVVAERLQLVAPLCKHDGCENPRALGRREYCDEHAAARVQESKNRWWRRHGAGWRNGAAA